MHAYAHACTTADPDPTRPDLGGVRRDDADLVRAQPAREQPVEHADDRLHLARVRFGRAAVALLARRRPWCGVGTKATGKSAVVTF